MVNFPRSTFTWKSFPIAADPHYMRTGFVGTPGQVHHVRFNFEARCEITDSAGEEKWECFLGAPCRTEYTIAERNLFQVPSNEWRIAVSRDSEVSISHQPGDNSTALRNRKFRRSYQNHNMDIRTFESVIELRDSARIVEATLENRLLNGATTYRDDASGLSVTVEFPVNLINLNETEQRFQICTGPVLLPDLNTWDGREVHRVHVAHVALSQFDHVEFILRHEVLAAPEAREWLDRPVGRDRYELRDPGNPPPGYPPERPKLKAYHDIREMDAENVVLMTEDC